MVALVVLLAGLGPVPEAMAQSATSVAMAPSCVPPGVSTRIVVLGAGWPDGPVVLSRLSGRTTTPVGTATARPSPVGGQAGTFTFIGTVTSDAPFRIVASRGEISRASDIVAVSASCPAQVSVVPPCSKGPGRPTVSGTGFVPGTVSIIADPFGAAESPPQTAAVDKAGVFSTAFDVAFGGAAVPIVATQPSPVGTVSLPPIRAVAFVDPCPPDPLPTTTSTRGEPTTTSTNTTAPKPGVTTTTVTPPGGDPPPGNPPITVPGATAKVSISPSTVRPGRCAVLVVSAAPPALPVVARYADGPAVNAQTGPDGGTVLSLCHAHDSGVPLGPVKVLIGIGPLAPVPVFTVLRVPPRPQPPLLQSGADSRRS